MAISLIKSLYFFLIIVTFGSLIAQAREMRESVFFGKTTPTKIDKDSEVSFSSSRAIEKASKFGVVDSNPNQREVVQDDDLASLYSNKIDQEEVDEVSDQKLKSESSNSYNVNNFEDKIRNRNWDGVESQQYGNRNNYKAYPYGIGETHYLNENRDQMQTYENQNQNENTWARGTNNKPYYMRKQPPWNEARKQGMSDTRYLDNGKYFYNVNKDLYSYENNNGYKPYQRQNNYDNYFPGNDNGNRFQTTTSEDNDDIDDDDENF